MPKKFEIFSNVDESGQLQKNVRPQIAEEINRHIGKRIRIIIERVGVTRSNKQNRYYWGCVIKEQIDCFKERWGELWDKDEVHDWNKNNIWHTEFVDEDTGEIIKRPGSSKKQSKLEFEERMEKLRQKFERDFEWRIPLPNEQKDLF